MLTAETAIIINDKQNKKRNMRNYNSNESILPIIIIIPADDIIINEIMNNINNSSKKA